MTRPAWTKSVRFQLTLWYVTTLAMILLLAAALLFWGVRRAMLRETDRILATEAAQIARLLIAPQEPTDVDAENERPTPAVVLEQAAPGARRLPGVATEDLYLRLEQADDRSTVALSPNLTPQNRLVPVLAALPSARVPRFAFTGPDEETLVRCLTVPVAQTPYRLQVATPWDPVEDLLARLTWGVGLAIGLFLLLSGIGSWLLVGRAFRPIERLVTEAEKMTADRLTPMLLSPRASDNEIGHLVRALNRMTARLSAAFTAQRQFTADASHEMRTPLTILQGEFELALARDRTAPDYRRALTSGLEETYRLTRIVDSLAFLARSDAPPRGPVSRQAVSLRVLAQDAAEAMARPVHEKQLHLTLQQDGDAAVQGDAEALHRVVRNLLDNAIRYTPADGRITILTTETATEGRLVVADSGIGIAPDDLPHIFDRFYRADKARVNDGGSGLGLSIVQSIVTAHGGRIEVESAPGDGSRFRVTLPKN